MRAIAFAPELVYTHINTSPSTRTVQLPKNHKKRPFFKRVGFVTRRHLACHAWCQSLGVTTTPGEDKNLADSASFISEFYDVMCKSAI